MASNGSFNTSGYTGNDGKLYLTFSWSIKSQDPATNKTVISWSLKGAGLPSGYYYKAGGFKVIINGQTVYSKSTDYRIELYTGTVVASGTATITHDTNGTKRFSASAEAGIYYYAVNCSGSGSWDLTPIPRYATSSQSLNDKTETTIKMNWASDSTVDYIWYSKDNGSNWTGVNVTDSKSGTYTISGLTPNTTYKIKTRVRRKDSQLTTDSSVLSVTTYNYPYCIEAPAFVIGEPVTLRFENPLRREFTFHIVCNGIEIENSWTISGVSYYGLGAESTKNQLYATMPNDPSANYSVITICDGYRVNYSNPNSTVSVDATECAPTEFDFYYWDTNEDVSYVTGDLGAIVKGYSNLLVGVLNHATARYGATMARYAFTIDTQSQEEPYSADTVETTFGAIKSAGVKRLSVRAYDSRGLSTLVYQDITVYDYEKPVINADIKRHNGFEAETVLKISGKYSRLTINGTDKNAMVYVLYRYRETNGVWTDWTALHISSNTAGEFVCADTYFTLDNSKSFEFEIQAKDELDTTTLPVPVDVGKAIFFISSNKKKCYNNGVEIPTFESVYPIGSVFCNSTNTNPSEIYGGTWELIDKGFKSGSTESSQNATDYLSKFNVASIRGGNTIRLRINVTTAKEIAETTVSLGTVDLAQHGLTKDDTGFFPYTVYSGVSVSDGANAVILVYFTSNGVLQTADAFQSNGTHTLPANTPFYFDVVLPVTPNQMLDEFCDKFYWKRIA